MHTLTFAKITRDKLHCDLDCEEITRKTKSSKLRISKASELLSFWEECHGVLEKEEWRKLFLSHECVADILKQRQERIVVAVRRNIKLHDVLEDLYKQDDRHLEFLDKYYPYRDSQPEELRSRIEQRERDSGRWGRRF